MSLNIPMGILEGGGAPYETLGVVFDGTNDWGENAGGFTGAADSKLGTFSVWYVNAATSASEKLLSNSAGSPNEIILQADDKLRVVLRNGSASKVYDATSTAAFSLDSNWHHLMIAWDLANTTVKIYLDGSPVAMTETTSPVDDVVDWTGTTIGLGAQPGGSSKWSGDMADYYLNIVAYIDPATDIDKFEVGGKPISLGATGNLPTGTAPIDFNRVATGGAADDFFTNLGTGGNWSINGALTLASTNPTD